MEVQLAETLPEVEILTAEYAQVLINLVQNALEPKAKHITVSTDADEAFVYLRVRDNGTGVPSDQIPKLFDPLFSTRNESGGTGLGLSIVTDSHGSIEVESAPREGTTMTVRLPRSAPWRIAPSRGPLRRGTRRLLAPARLALPALAIFLVKRAC